MRYEICIFVFVAFVIGAFGAGYYLGKSHAKVEYVTKEIEVVKYVEKKRSQVAARPNAGRDDLLKLMRSGKL